ncbi:MAG: hypothetical protein IPO88_23120 [Nannocystis sp.]|uniref:hypothetical protein n=1 Tax=Nannocystis sp. TaxID=1962667 RepID=UPI0024253239|nr:hypothetical protein [Nannocystis sp.]MBK9756336.1 hypothetical protein [Nannocystis sp.]
MSQAPPRPVPKDLSQAPPRTRRHGAPPGLWAALACALLLAPALPARAAAPADPAIQARASQAVADARAAFDRSDYATAITHFEAALALRPAPKIHYNLGVCHTRLYRAADARGDAESAARHASAAIDAFNTYLRAAPSADDRDAVADTVRALGGTPATPPRLRDPMDPAPQPDRPTGDPLLRPLDAIPAPTAIPAPGPAPAPTPAPAIPLSRGYLGVLLGLTSQPQLVTRTDLDGGFQSLLVLRGGALLGMRRRLALGGQLTLALPVETAKTNLALSTQTFLLDLGAALPLGHKRRFELPIGGFAGAAREALRVRAGQPLPTCAIQSTGTLVAARAGGVVGGRIGFAVLVGARRNHELGMHLTSAFHGFGRGPLAPADPNGPNACDGHVLQDVPRARFVLTSAIGYAFRF